MSLSLTAVARILRAAAAEADAIAAEQQTAEQRVARETDLLSLADCGIAVRTLRAAIRAGALSAIKVGREYMVQRSDLEAWLTTRRVQPRQAEPQPLTPAQRAIARAQADGSLRVVGGRR